MFRAGDYGNSPERKRLLRLRKAEFERRLREIENEKIRLNLIRLHPRVVEKWIKGYR